MDDDNNDDSNIVVKGFSNKEKFEWFCEPRNWKTVNGGSQLWIQPDAKTDLWRKTYYEPELINDNAAIYYCRLPKSCQYYTISTSFILTAACQFDQAGLCIRINSEYWIKAGIEVVDKVPKLSCVVTNKYSDWSTQTWIKGTTITQEDDDSGVRQKNDNKDQQPTREVVQVPECHIRIHCRGTSYVVEAKSPTDNNNKWEFIRIAHLDDDATTSNEDLCAGVFAACPIDQQGSGQAIFSKFQITHGSHVDHKAE